MKVLDVSEVIDAIDQLIKEKKQEEKEINAIRESVQKIAELDNALKGEGGNAIKEHFSVLHLPVLLYFQHFIDQYIQNLKDIKAKIRTYESTEGFVKEEFLTHDVKKGLTELKRQTNDTVDSINDEIDKISHLIGGGSISLASFNEHISEAKKHVNNTVSDLKELDRDANSILKQSSNSIAQLTKLTEKVNTWSKGGAILSKKTIKEVEKYFSETDVVKQMIDEAVDLAEKQDDPTMMGRIAEWLDLIGTGNGALAVTKGVIAVNVLATKMLELEKDGKGNFRVKASPKWTQGANGKYDSKVAQFVYNILKKGDPNSSKPIKKWLGKFQNKPSGLLRKIVGLGPNTTRISYEKILESQSFLKHKPEELKSYKTKVDVKGTLGKFKDEVAPGKLVKRVPGVGTVFSFVTNFSEFINDDNKGKSTFEISGRVAAGFGMDAGVAGMTVGGAALGSLICPGPGTLIGGAIGAGIGITGSIFVGDTVKEWGEDAGEWVEDRWDDMKDWTDKQLSNISDSVSEGLSKAEDFVTSWFR
ncbi:ribonuclease YeeF family protein [Bacillus haynesii]|uniref:ribonuclease YeeF family protein n=1 Tax=Bacillus haynesii TaxID=1925021 RepID=UPI00228265E2|nr:LXG domain-containing protein [Bacillus haynesii]MCY7814721.1 LXG domain-containing protein [Bacillus haynesii]MCY8222640.1 LXG domain-containing protein [Bacillus haynesii]MCY8239880.1 LXG domain-containing protein [Bacillus haynesii]MCY8568008.1 LXG domain-containing protein [Bacillus haynesii]MCY8663164.1 LXG domain-containing protein [Bacillus haynesii]